MYILVKADSTTYLNCENLGSYPTMRDASNAMNLAWNLEIDRQVQDGFIDEDEIDYACFTTFNYAQIARPHGWEAIKFYIFNTDEED